MDHKASGDVLPSCVACMITNESEDLKCLERILQMPPCFQSFHSGARPISLPQFSFPSFYFCFFLHGNHSLGDTAFRIVFHQGCDFPQVSGFRGFNHSTVQHWGVWGIVLFGMCGQSCPKVSVYTYLPKNGTTGSRSTALVPEQSVSTQATLLGRRRLLL